MLAKKYMFPQHAFIINIRTEQKWEIKKSDMKLKRMKLKNSRQS